MTQAELKSVLVYRPRLGKFEHPDGTPYHVRIQTRGYVQIRIKQKGRLYLAHRLAWLYMTGSWPDFEVDHDDGDPSNNKWKNLKAATFGHQRQNAAPKSGNRSGYTGLSWNNTSGRWHVRVGINGKVVSGGTYKHKEPAVIALKRLKAQLHTYHPGVVTRSTKLMPASPRRG